MNEAMDDAYRNNETAASGAFANSGTSAFDRRIDTCLEHGAEPYMPSDFAARVTAALPPAPVFGRGPGLAARAAWGVAILLLLALFVLAPYSAPTFASSAFDMELLLLAQLAAVACWLGTRRQA